MKHGEQISGFLEFLRSARQEYSIAQSVETDTNSSTQDLLHRLELYQDSYHDMARISKALKTVRAERREAKDTQAQLKAVVEWADENEKVIKSLERLLGDVRKAEKLIESRAYFDRTDIVKEILGRR